MIPDISLSLPPFLSVAALSSSSHAIQAVVVTSHTSAEPASPLGWALALSNSTE